MEVLILSARVVTFEDGDLRVRRISNEDAAKLVKANGFQSAIGHDSTAVAISQMLGVEIPVNRIQAEQRVGQKALVFSIKGRLPEGHIATHEELMALGASFLVYERLA